MEDYQTAFFERHKDTEILCSSSRKVAAMHFGGFTNRMLAQINDFGFSTKKCQSRMEN